jgi:hypothetical protein
VSDLARKCVCHIKKEGLLSAFKDAFFDVFMEGNCRKVFEAPGLVPPSTQAVLDQLEVWLHTLPQPPSEDTLWQS